MSRTSELLKSLGASYEFIRSIMNRLLSQQYGDEQLRKALGNEKLLDDIAGLLCGSNDVIVKEEIGGISTKSYQGEIISAMTPRLKVKLGDQVIAKEVPQVMFNTVGWIVGLTIRMIEQDGRKEPQLYLDIAFRDRRSECGQTLCVDPSLVELAPFKKGDKVLPEKTPVTPEGEMFEVAMENERKIATIFVDKGKWVLTLEGVSGIFVASKFNRYGTFGL